MHASPLLLALLASLLLPLAGCGTEDGEEAGASAGQATIPFEGHDAKEVLAALPEDLRAIVEGAEATTLLTLDPRRLPAKPDDEPHERFRRYPVLATAVISEAAEHRRLVEALYEGLKGEGAGPAGCFIPRHGLRFERDGRSVEFLICFQCTRVHVYRPDAEHKVDMLMGPGVKPVFDEAIKAHELPVAD